MFRRLMIGIAAVCTFVWLVAYFAGCASGATDESLVAAEESALGNSMPCMVLNARYPTESGDMLNVYASRTFYADGSHLGYDMALEEGTAIHPVACGIIRVYQSSKGYGELVVVIEHQLPYAIEVLNGKGENVTITSFLTIYGHLRKSQVRGDKVNTLPFKVGDMVMPHMTIGYVNDDAHNGDGAEHLHSGVRLQTAAEAKATDANWFRGYDAKPSQRKWFADPMLFLAVLTSNVKAVFWHPAGTALHRSTSGSYWMVVADGKRQLMYPDEVQTEHFDARAVEATDAELTCLTPAGPYLSQRAKMVAKFPDSPTVYEFTGQGSGHWRRAFISYEAFISWGWNDEDVVTIPASGKTKFLSQTKDLGYRTMRDGSLVKAENATEVSVVSQGQRLPIADWATFLALGYQPEWIVTLPKDTIDQVAGKRGATITSDIVGLCAHPSACLDACPPNEMGGGMGDGGAGGMMGSGGAGGAGAGNSSGSSSSASSSSSSGSSSSSSSSSSSGSSSSSSGSPSGVPQGKVLFQYQGATLPGKNQFQAMWDPPGLVFYDWVPSTFALCPDLAPGDGQLECLLDMPSGTKGFLFQVSLPDGSWWGDMSFDPKGGKGKTIGQVTLTGPQGDIPYVLVSNGSGSFYMNGFVALIP